MSSDACALLFFGLVKRFDLVLPTIRRRILRPNPVCDVFAHTYHALRTTNVRNGERNEVLRPWDVLNLTSNVIMETPGLFNASAYRSLHPVHRSWVYPVSVENMVLQWNSIRQVFRWATTVREYAAVGLFRLDVLYQTDLCVHAFADAVLPGFKHFGGVNDRMFVGRVAFARVWADRFSRVDAYRRHAPHRGVHSETFLKFVMRNVSIRLDTSVCFWRIRATGAVVRDCRAQEPSWTCASRKK